jgi:hypothetical protein
LQLCNLPETGQIRNPPHESAAASDFPQQKLVRKKAAGRQRTCWRPAIVDFAELQVHQGICSSPLGESRGAKSTVLTAGAGTIGAGGRTGAGVTVAAGAGTPGIGVGAGFGAGGNAGATADAGATAGVGASDIRTVARRDCPPPALQPHSLQLPQLQELQQLGQTHSTAIARTRISLTHGVSVCGQQPHLSPQPQSLQPQSWQPQPGLALH